MNKRYLLIITILLSLLMALACDTSGNNKVILQNVVAAKKADLTQSETDALLKDIWGKMKGEILAGNNEKALEYYHEASKQEHREIFNALGPKLKIMFSSPEQLVLVEMSDKRAEYEYLVIENGEKYSYPLVFIKNSDGIWKILDY